MLIPFEVQRCFLCTFSYADGGRHPTDSPYGGQAVMEGVMMRGRRVMAVAVRSPSGEIVVHTEPLASSIYTAGWAQLPLLRGVFRLWDALVLGTRALLFSANVALEEEPDVAFSGPMAWGTVAVGLGLAVGLFFLTPTLLANLVAKYISSHLLLNLLEGILRLGLVVGYIALVGRLPDIRRVFGYHGAEHQAINAYEGGAALEAEAIAGFSTLHPRCGTGFLLVVAVVAIFVFSVLGRPPFLLRLASRILLIPIIAGLSYELIRIAEGRRDNPLFAAVLAPCLALQKLSTRPPEARMREVALAALRAVLAEEGHPRGSGQHSV